MHEDLLVDCDSDSHKRAEGVAWLMILVFAIGLPLVYQALLYPHRERLLKADYSGCRSLAFLTQDYKPQYYWWEGIEIVRKLLLTGALVRFQKGSLIQMVAAMGVIALHLVFLAYCKPYKKTRDGLLALFVYSMLFSVFFAAILLSVRNAAPSSVLASGISTDTVAACLICCVLSVGVLTLLVAVEELYEARKMAVLPVMRHAGRNEPVVFTDYSDPERYHLFLSHVWGTGQDQVRLFLSVTIKKGLMFLVPRCSRSRRSSCCWFLGSGYS